MNAQNIETLFNTKLCWYCSNNKPAIGNQRKNGKSFTRNGSNDWKNESVRKYCKACNKTVGNSRCRAYDVYESPYEPPLTEVVKDEIRTKQMDRHQSHIDYKMKLCQDKIDERNAKKLSKKSKSKKTN